MTTLTSEPRASRSPRFEEVLPVADAVLYEGYALYPYRPSALKNRVPWNFGGVYPRSYSQAQTGADACEVFTECLIRGISAELTIEARFLELVDQPLQAGSEAAKPRSVRCQLGAVASLVGGSQEHSFTRGRLFGCVEVTAQALARDLFRVRVSLRNESNSPAVERAAALADTLVAAHLILGVQTGELVSLLEPPAELAAAAQACQQRGLWPVLAGKKGGSRLILASPIILYDYPQIAAESQADSYDATEIDEILLLRVLTLSAAEKQELRQGDSRARAILARAEALSSDELMRLHGRLQRTASTASTISVGERVRLCPKARADIFDLALAGRVATVRTIERDFEDRVHLSVTVDDDPGADLGVLGLPGHRFFFFVEEVERLSGGAP